MVRRPLWALSILASICLCTGNASAHPLGNFTINHLTEVLPTRGALTVRYTLDIAEIPTFQIMHAATTGWNVLQLRRWAIEESSLVTSGLRVTVDGAPRRLVVRHARAQLRPGAGGLPTLYWTGSIVVPIAPGVAHRVEINDGVYADRRIGWKDVVVAPQTDPTARLKRYPTASIGSPRHNDAARFTIARSGDATNVRVSEDDSPALASSALVRSGMLADLFSQSGRPAWLIALTVFLAFGLGALHGLEPGHGKALLAFTLVGARATIAQAGILAAALTFAHTIAVLLLGLGLFFFADFASESAFGWITLLSGIAVAIVGARALNSAIAHASPDHTHAESGLTPDSGRPLKLTSAIVAAMSGGVAPCPAAIVVLLTALRLHRVGEGLVLIVVFSLGLASVLTALGIAVVKGAAWITRRKRFDRVVRYAPLLTALVISTIGSFMVAQGFVAQGIATSVPIVALLTLAAIAGYSLVPRHRHGDAQTI